MPADLLIYMVIAAILIFWLRNTLGTRHGDERDRSDIEDKLKDKMSKNPQEKPPSRLIDIMDDRQGEHTNEFPLPEKQENMKGIKVISADVAEDLTKLMHDMPGFDPHHFITGSKDAFAMIVEAFARGDLQTLKDLLSPGVFRAFEHEINNRQDRGETVQTDIHQVKTAEILSIMRVERMVFIKIRFIAEETCVIKNRDGSVISGNPDKITVMNDVWTFGREIKSKNPTWHLFETTDDEVEDHKTPVPDAS